MKLRDYQKKGIDETILALESHKTIMVQSPTGSGKSLIICSLVKWAIDNNKKVLFCVDRKELVEQIKNTLNKAKIICGVIMSKSPTHSFLNVQVASIQTLSRRNKPKADLIIIDEAHATKSKSYTELWNLYKNAQFIGLTATPYRLSGEGFTDLFEKMIQTTSIKNLVDIGYLVGFKHLICSVPNFDKVGTKKGEYLDDDVIDELSTAPIVDSYLEHCEGKKGIVFAVNIEHSLQIVEKYQERGINAVHVDAETPKAERERIIDNFRKGEIKILSNVGLFTTGFDVPDIAFVQLLRMTKSLSLYLQMVGRGSRVLGGLIENANTDEERLSLIKKSDKPHCLILDHAGLFYEHGLATDDKDWEYYFSRNKLTAKKEVKEEDKIFAGQDKDGIIKIVKEPSELQGMILKEITKELATLTFFEKQIQEVVRNKNRKLLSAFFKYNDYLTNSKIKWNEELFDYVEHRLKIANKLVQDEHKFNIGFLYFKRKEYLR